MLREALILNLILCPLVIPKRKHKDAKPDDGDSSDELGGSLITALRNDANLDLSMDEEYEDLRAELLAYHTALASLTGPSLLEADKHSLGADAVAAAANIPNTRRSMKSTPCWQLGGICVNHKLCKNHKFLTEIAGCKDNLEVCCFTWNTFETRDLRDKGVVNNGFPWGNTAQVGGRGLIGPNDISESGLEDVHIPFIPVGLKGQANIIELDKKKNRKIKKNHYNKKKSPILVIVKQNKH